MPPCGGLEDGAWATELWQGSCRSGKKPAACGWGSIVPQPCTFWKLGPFWASQRRTRLLARTSQQQPWGSNILPWAVPKSLGCCLVPRGCLGSWIPWETATVLAGGAPTPTHQCWPNSNQRKLLWIHSPIPYEPYTLGLITPGHRTPADVSQACGSLAYREQNQRHRLELGWSRGQMPTGNLNREDISLSVLLCPSSKLLLFIYV